MELAPPPPDPDPSLADEPRQREAVPPARIVHGLPAQGVPAAPPPGLMPPAEPSHRVPRIGHPGADGMAQGDAPLGRAAVSFERVPVPGGWRWVLAGHDARGTRVHLQFEAPRRFPGPFEARRRARFVLGCRTLVGAEAMARALDVLADQPLLAALAAEERLALGLWLHEGMAPALQALAARRRPGRGMRGALPFARALLSALAALPPRGVYFLGLAP